MALCKKLDFFFFEPEYPVLYLKFSLDPADIVLHLLCTFPSQQTAEPGLCCDHIDR